MKISGKGYGTGLVVFVFFALPGWTDTDIQNGRMTEGNDTVREWKGGARDTEVFKSEPASLLVDGKGTSVQRVKGGGGGTIELAGWIKSEGDSRAQVAVQAFSKGLKQNKWIQLVYVQGDKDWREFSQKITLPEWTDFIEIKLVNDGGGKVWLDDIHEVGAAAPPPEAVKEPDDQTLDVSEQIRKSPPAKDKPWVAGWCIYDWRAGWFGTHNKMVERSRRGGVDVVAWGDSLIANRGDGIAAMAKRIDPDLTAVNYGIGGDSTRQILWRLQHGETEGLSPKVVIIGVGTNNLYKDQNEGSDEEVVKGIRTVVETVQEKLPSAQILLISILPRQDDYFSGRAQKINERITRFYNGDSVRVLDMWDDFYDAVNGSPELRVKKELYRPDALHLMEAGYEVWDRNVERVLREMLGY